ncbi:MAG: hypothetical protein JWO36_1181 [Myxococcales bacterium]|nr:hypothetical protein [Myxococcales bacterium]
MVVTLQVAELRPQTKYQYGAADPVCAPGAHGSFQDRIARRRAPEPVSQRPLTKATLVRQEPLPYELRPEFSEKAQSEHSHRQTIHDLLTRLVGLVVASFASKDGDAWVDYWAEHLHEYQEQSTALRKLMKLIGMQDETVEGQADECDLAIVDRFPDAAGEFAFLEYTVHRCRKRIVGFKSNIVDEENRAADAEAATRFNYFAACYSMCLTALALIATPQSYDITTEFKPSDDVVESIWTIARFAALEMNDASTHGANYRTPVALREEDAPAVARATEIADDFSDAEERIRRHEQSA